MANIPLPTIKFGKRKERSQMCEILTDDGRWVDKELPALYSCVQDEQSGLAFLIDPQNQYLSEDNTWHQLLSEKSQVPICLREKSIFQDGDNDEKELNDISDQLFVLTSEQAQAEQFEKARQSEVWNKILWIVSIICGVMLLLGAMNYFKG